MTNVDRNWGSYIMDRSAWLAQTEEDIIEPERPICDPHHHLWDFPTNRYLLDELLEDTGTGHHIVSTVFVECTAFYREGGPAALRPVGETEFVNGQAAMAASGRYGTTQACAGIVSFADLCLGDRVQKVLEAHIAAGGPAKRFKGIRHAAGWDASEDVANSHTNPPQHLLLDKTFREGFARLAPLGLSFEGWQYFKQIPELTDLARAFPETTIILNHFGGPMGIGPYEDRWPDFDAQWRADIAELAKCENVVAKLGGLGMARCGFKFHRRDAPPGSEELAEAWGPFMHHAIEQFGPGRCMFESNFPVDKVSCSYPVLWNALKRIAAGYSEDEKQAMFHDTAVRVYRLAEDG